MTAIRKQYFVVDQNYLRTLELETLLAADPSVRVILPDLAFLEMAKGEHQELTVRQNLRVLAQFPGRVKVARSVGQALRQELDTRKATSGLMAPIASTKIVREVLGCLAADPETAAIKRLLDQPTAHVDWLKRTFLDDEDNKSRALLLVEAIKIDTGAAFARDVRSAKASFEDRLDFVAEQGPSKLLSALTGSKIGFPLEKARIFLRSKSMLLRYFYLNLWNALDWEAMGRLEGLSPKKVTNDYMDREYVLSATYFDGLLSKDRQVSAAFKALKLLLLRRA